MTERQVGIILVNRQTCAGILHTWLTGEWLEDWSPEEQLRYKQIGAQELAEALNQTLLREAALEAKLKEAVRDRDELWCRALTTLEDLNMVQKVLVRFDQLRPDAQEEQRE